MFPDWTWKKKLEGGNSNMFLFLPLPDEKQGVVSNMFLFLPLPDEMIQFERLVQPPTRNRNRMVFKRTDSASKHVFSSVEPVSFPGEVLLLGD